MSEKAEKTFSGSEVKSLVETILAQNAESMKEFASVLAQELRKPAPEAQKKLDDERKRLIVKAKTAAFEAMAQQKAEADFQSQCAHLRMSPYGKVSAWAGQVLTGGWVQFHCTQCRKNKPAFKAPMEWIQNGVNSQLNDVNNPLLHLTEKGIEQMGASYGWKPEAQPRGFNPAEQERINAYVAQRTGIPAEELAKA
jgi:hypothetical protein